MGGGVFKFCSAVTEKSSMTASSSGHNSGQFSSFVPAPSVPSSTTLHWPLLLAANCVVGCFLAALAIGYTFFLTWDKQMILNFLTNKGDSNDHLIMNETYDYSSSAPPAPANNERCKPLCSRCKNSKNCSATLINSLVTNKNFEVNRSLAPYPCCHQIEYCCNNPTVSQHKSHCNPHAEVHNFSQNGKKQTSYKNNSSFNDHRMRCSQCPWDQAIHFNSASYPQSASLIFDVKAPAPYTGDTTQKFWTVDGHANATQAAPQNLGYSNHFGHIHNEELSTVSIDLRAGKEPAHKHESFSYKFCDDPICQQEQLRFHRQKSLVNRKLHNDVEAEFQLRRTRELNPFKEACARDSSWNNYSENSNISSGNHEHMYSNIMMENYMTSMSSIHRPPADYSSYPCKPSHCSSHCACAQRAPYYSFRQADWDQSIQPSRKQRYAEEYFLDTEKSTELNFSQAPLPGFRYNCSTLPAKFSAKHSNFLEEDRSQEMTREFKSCVNITEVSVGSLDLIKSSRLNSYPRRNYSAPSLKAKIDEFDKRKLVKTVKFITPHDEDEDEDDEDSDSDYYIKRTPSKNVKDIKRVYLPADGSSPIRELCSSSSTYR
ncbi:uncharacterized protein LOC125179435 [Hyalella azteca]|uniref:Uncharacterized protein LOC125179435 n=1 Tax=Hyalella azteca TaxID=294128 RepID=A0A979FX65_HYAAZ|nr:uncharacterized protein LOC125179435 [Hyalella azteca]